MGEWLRRPVLSWLWKQVQHPEQAAPLSPLWVHHVQEVHGICTPASSSCVWIKPFQNIGNHHQMSSWSYEVLPYMFCCYETIGLWSLDRKADQWDTRGPVRAWKPCSFPFTTSRRWQQWDGLQEGQHQQSEQCYFHAGGKGRWKDSLLSPLYGHTAEEATEVGREGPCARYSETLWGKINTVGYVVFFLFHAVLSLHCCILPVIHSHLSSGVSCCSLAPNLSSCQRLRMCMEKVDERAPEYIRMAESLK